MRAAWIADWMWGLPLTALTIAIHVAAIVGIAAVLRAMEPELVNRDRRPLLVALRSIVIIGVLGWTIAALHGLEALIWAAAYMVLNALPTFSDAVLYSVDSLTTRGESGLRLDQQWRLLGALEAGDGVLLFGISTAFLFAVAAELRSARSERPMPPICPPMAPGKKQG